MGASQRGEPYHDPLVHGINDIQDLSMTHEVISRSKTEVLHRLQTHYLPLYFPEVDRFRNNTRSDWFFALLERFPVPSSISDTLAAVRRHTWREQGLLTSWRSTHSAKPRPTLQRALLYAICRAA